MCEGFFQNGHQVTLVASNRSTGKELTLAETFGFEPSFKIQKISGNLFFYPRSKFAFALNALIFNVSLFSSINLKLFDLIYCRDEWIGWVASLFVDAKKIIYESHEAKYNWAVKQLLKKGMKLVVISDGIKEFYLEQGIRSERIHVAHDAVDDSFFKEKESKQVVRERLRLPADAFIAMYIGGFDTWKGVETFFAAAEHTKGVTFATIGGSEAEIVKYRAEYPLVRFLGPRPYGELAQNQQATDVLVIPNTAKNDLSAKYTSPLKLFAHMASGVPIMASNIPSLRTVVDDSQATLFTPDDPKDLSRTLEKVKNNYSAALQKAERAFEVSKTYTWANRAKCIIDFVQK